MRRVVLMGGREWTSDFEKLHAAVLAQCQRKQVLWLLLTPDDRDGGVLGAELRANDFYEGVASKMIGELGGVLERRQVLKREGAADGDLLEAVRTAEWIHLFCMAPEDAMFLLADSPLKRALESAGERGTILSGAAGAAMLLCQYAWSVPQDIVDRAKRLWDRAARGEIGGSISVTDLDIKRIDCLGVAPPAFLLPHFNMLESLMMQFLLMMRATGSLERERPIVCADDGTAITNLFGDFRVWGSGRIRVTTDNLAFRDFEAGDAIDLHAIQDGASGREASPPP